MTKSPGLCSKNAVLRYYKVNAQRRGLEWSISDETAKGLIASACHYCGAKSSMKTSRSSVTVEHNGIDRKDSSVGYINENCVACCKTCNSAKGTLSADEFVEWAHRLSARWSPRTDSPPDRSARSAPSP